MAQAAGARRSTWTRLVVLAACVLVVVAVLASGVHELLSFSTLHRHHAALGAWVAGHSVLALAAFMAAYAASVALSLPGAVWLTIAGGYLFGTALAAGAVIVAATAGATAIFLIARYVGGGAWRARLGSGRLGRTVRAMEERFQGNPLSAMLVLRLVPLFPFWLVNLVPALFGVPLGAYVLGTALGIVPATVVYAGLGAGLGEVLSRGEAPDLSILWEPSVLVPLLGLAAVAALPMVLRRRRPGR